jgi:rubrerythrin
MAMALDEAIKTAIEFEKKVYKVYEDAKDRIADPVGKRIFKQLSLEEAQHVSYLQHRLNEWEQSGRIDVKELATVVPDGERIAEGREKIFQTMQRRESPKTELEYLKSAFEVEKETSSFYRRMVSELTGEGQDLFSRFMEIEEGHIAIVQAEIDSVQGMGFWFDVMEFDLEAG